MVADLGVQNERVRDHRDNQVMRTKRINIYIYIYMNIYVIRHM